ncbi:MAG: hypothetical protein NTX61_13445 [Bacteroidetes bacterium]|nr:hypothetical protein [Bacteroidota bacterium]
MNLATYNFQSWLRKGIGNAIQEMDNLGNSALPGGTGPRASIRLSVSVNVIDNKADAKDFQIIGPADIIGFSHNLVIRTEPVHFNTNFPPNYLAHIEFYDEDLPWRYTPAKADGEKLRPWISLVVLKESEFKRLDAIVPLPQIQLIDAPLPPSTETWLWAHVQTIEATSLSSDQVQPDHIISRLICPRKLEANTAYYAFVIPTFESGRLAGLGCQESEILKVKSQDPSWGLTPPPAIPQNTFPVYYEWYFHTGNEQDFEYLAGLLKPRLCDEWVGRKPLDCANPGWFDSMHFVPPFMLYFEGALKSPQVPENFSVDKETQKKLDDFSKTLKVNFEMSVGSGGDPVVTPPFYGQKHIFEETLSLKPDATWIHELNRDPRWRIPAGFGGEIMRRYQDHYLQKAWEQLDSIVEANKIIAAAVNTLAVSVSIFKNHFTLPDHELLSLTAPVHVKILRKVGPDKSSTLSQLFIESCFNGSVYGSAFRRLVRKRGPFRRIIERKGGKLDFESLGKLIIENSNKAYPVLANALLKAIVIKDVKFEVNNNLESDSKFSMSNGNGDNFSSYSGPDYKKLQELLQKFANIVKPETPNYKIIDCNKSTPVFDKSEIDPSKTIPALLKNRLTMPVPGWFDIPEKIKPALAYPDFEDPMWDKLKELSTEWLIPNLHLIPNNTITLLQPNQKFIESFIVGLNVEMNREMRWREYPTDERGSCFRQFWDVKGIKDLNGVSDNKDKAKIVEHFKDTTPIDTWKNWGNPTDLTGQALGSHYNRAPVPVSEGDHIVLALRGDLFKNFPDLSVYAVRAIIDEDNVPRIKTPSDPIDPLNPITDIKFPVFKADIGADVKFLGFDLSKTAAIGTTDPGWFFVLQETPGETRFGLDINGPANPVNWDEISWPLLGDNSFIETGLSLSLKNINKTEASWGTSSADMAYILFQKPVMIVIHASKMLEEL